MKHDTDTAMVVRASDGQSPNLMEWQDRDGNVVHLRARSRVTLVLVILLVVGFTLELGFAAGLVVASGLGLIHLSHDAGVLALVVALAALLGQGGALAVWRRL